MNILIIEDETPAARRLEKLIKEIDASIHILAKLDSIETAVTWFKNNVQPDLAFMDIELADGQSFEIFNQVHITCPVIFATAYDEYALKAFEVNSIDYLLKPIEEQALNRALNKFKLLKYQTGIVDIQKLLNSLQHPVTNNYKKRFLIKMGDKYLHIDTSSIAYFISEDKLSFIITNEGKKYVIDGTLDFMETQLDPSDFFRLNRQLIANISNIKSVFAHFNGKLKITLQPEYHEEVFVSREKAGDFKKWMGE
ncbi:MAG: LytTR family DNA-binding domain-containing protein [Bacteroidota bacterium]|nr:LytTR family DNA-binding domain-containing protein [Bacteroidota bacterium]